MLNFIRGRLFQAGAAVSALILASPAPIQAAPTETSTTRNSATPAQGGASTATPRAAAQNNRPRRICVRVEQSVGSRINRTACLTQAEWDREGGVPTN
jgi:hypothetical protein